MMLEKAHALAAILERMTALYRRVNESLSRERRALVAFDFEDFFVFLREKDELLSSIRALDNDRIRIQDQFALIMDKRPEDLSLEILAQSLLLQDEDMGTRLLTLRMELKSVVDEVSQQVINNKAFTEKSISALADVASHLSRIIGGSKQPQRGKGSVYNKKALQQKATGLSSGSIVEKRY